MKRQIRASLAFKQLKPVDKASFGANVISSLTAAGTAFPNLPVTLTQLTAINTAFTTLVAKAASGTHQFVAQLKEQVPVWNDAFTKTADYVSLIAAGSDSVVRSGGFLPTKGDTSPSQKPGEASDFKATINGSKGTIKAGTKKSLSTARALIFTAAPDGVTVAYDDNTMKIIAGDKTVYVIVDTQRQTEFFNLPSSTAFNVNVYGVNSAGAGPATTPQQVVTQ